MNEAELMSRINRGGIYFFLAVILLLMAAAVSNLALVIILSWIALGASWFGLGYATGRGELLFKSPQGRLPIWVKLLVFPILSGVTVYNYFARRVDKSPPLQEILPGVWLGRRLFPSDIPEIEKLGIRAILDVTAEFDALSGFFLLEGFQYLNIPVFDHATMRLGQLKQSVRWMHEQRDAGRSVLVHCALGQGRSVAVLLAFLKTLFPERSYESLLIEVQTIRNRAQPNRRQMESLIRFEHDGLPKRKPKVCMIHNPVCGAGQSEEDLIKIHELLDPHVNLQVKETSEKITASQLSREAIREGYQTIVASGGDGTVSEVASELVGHDITFGVIPRGTANALAVCIYGKSMLVDPVGTGCRHVVAGNTRMMDVAEIDGKHMFLLAGVGIEAGMVERADSELKRKWGPLAYIVGAIVQMKNQELFHAELEIDGEVYSFATTSIVVANAAPLSSMFAQGGGEPVLDDGLLDVTVLVDNGNGNVTVDFETLLGLWDHDASSSDDYPGIRYFQGKSVTIQTDPAKKMVLDGELIEAKDSFVFQMRPGTLKYLGEMQTSEKHALKAMATSSVQAMNASMDST